MSEDVRKALHTALERWDAMSSGDNDDAESTADGFQSAFYQFIDALRDWVHALEPQPRTLEELKELPLMKEIEELLPAPLLLNFETEAELIVDGVSRIDDAKYD